MLGIPHPGICRVYHTLYMPGIHHPVYTLSPTVSREPPSLPVSHAHAARTLTGELTDGNNTFSPEVDQERPLRRGSLPLSHQNKPPLPTETGLKGQRNPLQRVVLHKDLENVLTPLNLPSNLP